MILAAAIKYHIKKTGKDVILCGARHGDIFSQLEQLGFGPRDGYDEIEQGFIDHHNNFLTREEAMSMQKCVVSFVQKLYTKEKKKAHSERK